ncbi:hypothetical protein QOZ80_1BG0066620 [Eleusine coracana subsp. coracana]|nr:hypothetical protein QOZ80_1BG0066620 [Eleusine coracana subsp. coracana]
MDFHALPRRDLQALCKRNAIRANMSNAAMADALRSLQSVEGIDEIRTAAPPGMSAVKSAAEEVAGEEHRHGCLRPRGRHIQSGKGTVAADKIEKAAPAPDGSLKSQQNTAARDATAPVDAEAVSIGKRRTRRSRRSRVKMVSDQEEEAAVAKQKELIEPILFEAKSAVGKDQHNGCPLPRGGRGRATRSRSAAHKMEDAVPAADTLQSTQKTAAQEAAVPVNVEEVSTGKRKTRRSRRSKVKMALGKKEGEEEAATAYMEPIADSSDVAIGDAVVSEKSHGPKEEAVVEEEATKPQEDEMHHQNPSIYSGKRRMRRSKRSNAKMTLDKKDKVAAATRKELIADSSEGVIGSAVVYDKTCNDFKEENLSVVEAGATNLQEGIVDKLEPTSTVQNSPNVETMKDAPIRCILSMAESRGPTIVIAQDASVRGGRSFSESPVDEIIYKIDTQDREDGFSLTGEVDQSNLLVNTLDKFVKPMYKFAVEEKKEGECWWMLM